MTEVTRRTIVAGMAVAAAAIPATASAQSTQKPPAPQPQANPPAGQPAFGFEDVIKRAREVSAAPYDDTVTPLPEQLTKLCWVPPAAASASSSSTSAICSCGQ